MKKYLCLIIASLAMLSCEKQEVLPEEQSFGTISIRMTNHPVVEVRSRAVSADDFRVCIFQDETLHSEYVYKDMPAQLTVLAGRYTVMAENVTEADALTKPTQWGQIRYAGSDTQMVEVNAHTAFNVLCRVANSAVSVNFDETLDAFCSNCSVQIYSTEDRKLTCTAQSAQLAYFSPGTLHYEFTATLADGTPKTHSGTVELQAATNTHLNFKISEPQGSLIRPEIEVDATCEEFYKEIMLDPSQGLQ